MFRVSAQTVPIWGDCPDDITEGIEELIDHKIDKTLFSEHAAATLLFQLEEGCNLGFECIQIIMQMEICFKQYIYHIHEIRTVNVNGEMQLPTARFILLFKQRTTRMQ